MLDSEATNIAALESCIGKTPGRCIQLARGSFPYRARATARGHCCIDSDAQNACHPPGSIVGSRHWLAN
jgi:hypothetical protein